MPRESPTIQCYIDRKTNTLFPSGPVDTEAKKRTWLRLTSKAGSAGFYIEPTFPDFDARGKLAMANVDTRTGEVVLLQRREAPAPEHRTKARQERVEPEEEAQPEEPAATEEPSEHPFVKKQRLRREDAAANPPITPLTIMIGVAVLIVIGLVFAALLSGPSRPPGSAADTAGENAGNQTAAVQQSTQAPAPPATPVPTATAEPSAGTLKVGPNSLENQPCKSNNQEVNFTINIAMQGSGTGIWVSYLIEGHETKPQSVLSGGDHFQDIVAHDPGSPSPCGVIVHWDGVKATYQMDK